MERAALDWCCGIYGSVVNVDALFVVVLFFFLVLSFQALENSSHMCFNYSKKARHKMFLLLMLFKTVLNNN